MDDLIWLARIPGYAGDPLSVARRIMRRARHRVGASEDEFGAILQGALKGRTITGAVVRAWESRPPPPPGDVLVMAIGLMGLDLVVELAEDSGRTGRLDSFGENGPADAELALPSVDVGRLHAAVANGSGVDRRFAEDLAILTEEYWCLYHRMAPRSLQPVVGAHHDLLSRLLASAPSSPLRGQLASALGQAAMLDGWLSFLLDDRRTARARWALAEDVAQEFDDRPLHAHVLIARSSLVSTLPHGGLPGESTVAITLLDEAERLVASSTPPLRAWLLARRAEEHAAAGRRSAAESRASAHDLATAERLLIDGAAGCLPGPTTELDWNGFRGNCALLLGRDDEAVNVLSGAGPSWMTGHAAHR